MKLKDYLDNIKSVIPKVDSFRLEIPYEYIEYCHPSIGRKVCDFCFDTSELDIKTERYINTVQEGSKDHIKRYYSRVLRNNINKQRYDEFMVFLINSKVLKDKYLQGISNDTWDLVSDFIEADGYVSVKSENLLKYGKVSDIDFCKDYNIGDCGFETRKGFLSAMRDAVPYSKQLGKGFKFYERQGLQISNRNYSCYTNPFGKFYPKFTELLTNSVDFTKAYLSNQDIPNDDKFMRFEITLKRRKEFKQLGIEKSNLGYVLDNIEMIWDKVYNNFLSRQFDRKLLNTLTEKFVNCGGSIKSNDLIKFVCIAHACRNKEMTPKEASIWIYKTMLPFHKNRRSCDRARQRHLESFDKLLYSTNEHHKAFVKAHYEIETKDKEGKRTPQ